MNRYQQRAAADRTARTILDREIRINRQHLGVAAATQHGQKISDTWLATRYAAIEAQYQD